MAIGSKELTPIELDTYEDERLLEELKKAKEELFNLRFQSATGQLESHGRLRAVKRDIARIYTVIRERELGIRATPVVEVKAPKKAADKAEKPAAKAPAKTTTKKPADAAEAPEAAAVENTDETAEEAK